ncbi:MAG: glycosyltransferase family A protein [Tepidisphaeraceae bacterium]
MPSRLSTIRWPATKGGRERRIRVESQGLERMPDNLPPPGPPASGPLPRSATLVTRARRRYAVISPCRDEARYARTTIESVLEQSERPTLWVIVDDGSKDETPAILAEYAAKHPFIKIVRRADRGERVLGSGVMEAFYDGLRELDLSQFDYICKLDLDLDLPRRYFETLMNTMEADERLGALSGKPYFTRDNQAISEKCGDEHAVGMSKFYRVECFQQIGGFVKQLMWDGIDTHRCRMKGWKAASLDGENLRFIHLRPMGSSHKSWTTGRVRHGRGQWFMGTHPLYMFASGLFRMTRPPIILGGAAMLWGYIKSMFKNEQRYDDPEFRKFLRSYQLACMLHGKRKATQQLESRQAAVWKPSVRAGR